MALATVVSTVTRATLEGEPVTVQVDAAAPTVDHPYFALTGTIWAGTRRRDSAVITSGAIGDTLAAIYPELAAVHAVHLSDERGAPMHAVANGLHWARATRRHAADPAALARHWRVDRVRAIRFILRIASADDRQAEAEAICGELAEQWARDAAAAREAIAAWADTHRSDH